MKIVNSQFYRKAKYLSILLYIFCSSIVFGQQLTLHSPSKTVSINILLTDSIHYSVNYNNVQVTSPSAVALVLANNITLGLAPKIKSQKEITVTDILEPVYGIADQITDHYTELTLVFKGNYSLVFRAYDNGTAYRFQTDFKNELTIIHEQSDFNFTKDHTVYFPEVDSLMTTFEAVYQKIKLSELQNGKFAFSPVLVDLGNAKAVIMESDLQDYPGMFIEASGKKYSLTGKFAPYPASEKLSGKRNHILYVTGRKNYLAKTTGKRSFPWRVIALAQNDKDLLHNTLVYQLASPSENTDWGWIKPGMVAWDWWSNINLQGVPFEAGMNTATFKYFIDFAANNKLPYVNIDAGWSNLYELFELNPEMDMEEITSYAKNRGVGLFLWCAWYALEKEWEQAFNQFQEWGIAGLKIDYMNRDDQKVVKFYEKVVKEAAIRKMLINFHGAFKPTGLYRTYPNLINREGVIGLEHNKWSVNVTPDHDVTIPFTRMVAGPMDYTPGAMINRTMDNFKAIRNHPMSQGTRCHQLAMYVVYFAPLQMLADAPTNYLKNSEILNLLSSLPTVWDKTISLTGEIGQYIAIARKYGNMWYIGGMTNKEAREIKVPLNFLNNGDYEAIMFLDGPNAHRNGEDYRVENKKVSKNDVLTINMKPGGGFIIKLEQPAKK